MTGYKLKYIDTVSHGPMTAHWSKLKDEFDTFEEAERYVLTQGYTLTAGDSHYFKMPGYFITIQKKGYSLREKLAFSIMAAIVCLIFAFNHGIGVFVLIIAGIMSCFYFFEVRNNLAWQSDVGP